MAHLLRTSFHQNPHVGLSGFANNNICILANTVEASKVKTIEKVLNVQTIQTNIAHSHVVGALIAGNDNGIIIPQIVMKSEIQKLKDIPHTILDTKHTALGNNIATTNDACLINPDLEDQKAEIKSALKVKKIKALSVADHSTVGSMIVVNDKGCLVSAFATEDEAETIGKFFKLPATRATVNLGSPYIGAGIIVNDHGFIIGTTTTGVEAINIDQGLGFLDQ